MKTGSSWASLYLCDAVSHILGNGFRIFFQSCHYKHQISFCHHVFSFKVRYGLWRIDRRNAIESATFPALLSLTLKLEMPMSNMMLFAMQMWQEGLLCERLQTLQRWEISTEFSIGKQVQRSLKASQEIQFIASARPQFCLISDDFGRFFFAFKSSTVHIKLSPFSFASLWPRPRRCVVRRWKCDW